MNLMFSDHSGDTCHGHICSSLSLVWINICILGHSGDCTCLCIEHQSMCPAHLLILRGPRERSHSPFTYYSTTPPSNTAQGPFINQTANIRTSNATLNTKVKVTTHIYTPLSSEKCRCLLFVHFDVYFLLPWVNTRDRRKMGDWDWGIGPWQYLDHPWSLLLIVPMVRMSSYV